MTGKARLRTDLKALRAAADATPGRRAALAQKLSEVLPLLAAGRCLAGYVPLPSEADPLPAMAAHAGPLCLPVVRARDAALGFCRWSPGQALAPGVFGQLEPAATSDADWLRPEVVIVPLVGFDATGQRLGYGGGYYDRTLAALRSDGGNPVLAVGLAYDVQEVAALPHEPTDAPLDAIVTEVGLRRFNSAAS